MKIFSDEYKAAWDEVLDCAKLMSKYEIGTERRAYWESKYLEAKKIRDKIRAEGRTSR